jgi:hypothetical protein
MVKLEISVQNLFRQLAAYCLSRRLGPPELLMRRRKPGKRLMLLQRVCESSEKSYRKSAKILAFVGLLGPDNTHLRRTF